MAQAHTKSSHKFCDYRIMRVIHIIRGWSFELQDVFLKNKHLELRRSISNLFHSMIVNGKREFLENCFLLKKGYDRDISCVI